MKRLIIYIILFLLVVTAFFFFNYLNSNPYEDFVFDKYNKDQSANVEIYEEGESDVNQNLPPGITDETKPEDIYTSVEHYFSQANEELILTFFATSDVVVLDMPGQNIYDLNLDVISNTTFINTKENIEVTSEAGKFIVKKDGEIIFESYKDSDDLVNEKNIEYFAQHTFRWNHAEVNDGSDIYPDHPDLFNLNFSDDGSISISTDCNSKGGTFSLSANRIVINLLMTTLAYCEDAQESEFENMFSGTINFFIDKDGNLIFNVFEDETYKVEKYRIYFDVRKK
ncbi:META domain-containing protein [Candidatus Nomurabacteria bacterium]|nr:META domain-containing protein [Candidatus Nomurabacteria bacterium]